MLHATCHVLFLVYIYGITCIWIRTSFMYILSVFFQGPPNWYMYCFCMWWHGLRVSSIFLGVDRSKPNLGKAGANHRCLKRVQVSDRLLLLENGATQRRLGSKIDAKSRTSTGSDGWSVSVLWSTKPTDGGGLLDELGDLMSRKTLQQQYKTEGRRHTVCRMAW